MAFATGPCGARAVCGPGGLPASAEMIGIGGEDHLIARFTISLFLVGSCRIRLSIDRLSRLVCERVRSAHAVFTSAPRKRKGSSQGQEDSKRHDR